MTVDISKIKPGDEVLVRGVIVPNRHPDGEVWVDITFRNDPDASTGYRGPIRAAFIASHTPKALAVGDRVKPALDTRMPDKGVIRGVHEGRAWVEWDELPIATFNERNTVWKLKNLERADDQ